MMVASSVFATGLAAHVYEAHATVDAAGVQTCTVRRAAAARACVFCSNASCVQGNVCFRATFLALSALSAGGAALAGVLATILAGFYKEVVAARTAAEPGGYFAALGLHACKLRSADAL
jgi:hypothetical protein